MLHSHGTGLCAATHNLSPKGSPLAGTFQLTLQCHCQVESLSWRPTQEAMLNSVGAQDVFLARADWRTIDADVNAGNALFSSSIPIVLAIPMTLCGGAHVCGGLLYRRDSGPHSSRTR